MPAGTPPCSAGTLGTVLAPGASGVQETLRSARPSATTSFDPNARPTLMGEPAHARTAIEELIGLADVVKVSDEDVEWLCPGEALDDVVRRWAALGPSLVVVTRGAAGAFVHVTASGEETTLPARSVPVIDTVGAGDSFMAGLLSGLLDAGLLGGPEARERLRWATLDQVRPSVERALATSGVTVSRAGAHAPHRSELDA